MRVFASKRWLAGLAALVVWGAGLWTSAPAFASHLYLTSGNGMQLFPFSFDADGSLVPIACPGGNCTAGLAPGGVAVTPDGQFLYTANGAANTVASFAIAADGSLTPIPCSGSNCNTGRFPTGIAVSPNGRFVYAVDQGASIVSAFAIAADGSLRPVACPGTTCNTGAFPNLVAISPNGDFLYTTDTGANTVSAFAIAADGSLTPIPCPGSNCNTGSHPWGIVVSPNGRSLYTINDFDGTVSPFAIGADGSLTPIPCPGSDCTAASTGVAIAVSPNGRFLYTAGGGVPGSLSVFAIAADGSLTRIPCPGSNCTGGTDPSALAVSPSGRFLYMASELSNDHGMISVFAIGADGLPSPVNCPGGNCSTGSQPYVQSLAISPDQAPVAAFAAKPAPPGSATSFDASGSTAAPGQAVARYDWSFGDGTSATNAGATQSHAYAAAGRYTVTLTVTDDAGCSTTLVFTGQTASCNGGPTATETLEVSIAEPPGAQITAPAPTASYVVGQVVGASFSCTDGTGGPGITSCTGTAANGAPIDTTHPGPHSFTVIATSGDGQSSTTTVHYTVVIPSNQFRVSHLKVHRNGRVNFDVTVPYAGRLDVLETSWSPSPRGMVHTALLRPGPHRYAFARRHLNLARAGTIQVTVTPSARGVRQVRRHRRPVRINLWVTYQPAGGAPANKAFIDLLVTK